MIDFSRHYFSHDFCINLFFKLVLDILKLLSQTTSWTKGTEASSNDHFRSFIALQTCSEEISMQILLGPWYPHKIWQ